jgi:acyl-CoA synthetase (AMP-forming)/AMP-acid ligase II
MLRELGVSKGDRVAIMMPNSWEYAVAYYGIVRLGAISVNLNWRCAAPELEYMLNDSGASYLLMSPEYWGTIKEIKEKCPTLKGIYMRGEEIPDGVKPFKKLLEQDPGQTVVADPPVTQDDVAAILYTSGTTGVPKGAMQTHRNLISNACIASRLADGNETDRTLIIAPMFHATGINSQLTAFLSIGGCSIIRPAFIPEDTLAKISEEKITFGAGVAAMFLLLMMLPNWKEYDLSSLRYFVFGGSAVPVPLFEQIIEALPHVQFGNVWGLTECTSITSWNPHVDILRIPDAVGPAAPILEVKVVDEKGNELPRGEIGELMVKGPSVVKGYWNKPEATAETFVEGWLHTGDLGYMDEDDYIRVVDRIKDMIISGGENIYCIEVENAILQHPAVLEAAVVGVPDPVMGEAVKAVVVLKPGMTATEEEIIEHTKKYIASYKKPKYVIFTDTLLPKNPGGKVIKSLLKDM